MRRELILALFCITLSQSCSNQKSVQRCGRNVLYEVRFPEFMYTNASLCDVVQFMANEVERLKLDKDTWPLHFIVEIDNTIIDIQPTTRDESWPIGVKIPRLSVLIEKQITLKEALDAVCEKVGFQWKVEDYTYIRIFKPAKEKQR